MTETVLIRDPLAGVARAQVQRAQRLLSEYDDEVVERVDELIAGGYSDCSIAAMLNAAGLPGLNNRRWCERGVRRLVGLMRTARL